MVDAPRPRSTSARVPTARQPRPRPQPCGSALDTPPPPGSSDLRLPSVLTPGQCVRERGLDVALVLVTPSRNENPQCRPYMKERQACWGRKVTWYLCVRSPRWNSRRDAHA